MEPSVLPELVGLPANSIPVAAALAIYALTEIRGHSKATDAEKQDAELALAKAYMETDGYYRELNSGSISSPSREAEIAYMWEEASVKLRKFNKNLSKRLSYKSKFWQEGAAWTREQIERADITLDAVHNSGALTFR
ncbi:hypothetical protein [Vibrio cyclitrophicus]|uniref:hypothetical protein n=1 Tax=Vibrio cyclitrophicus TaxID=47951 RepID=UPI0002D2C7F2|nr:hypothetical protein [Vibrio cyclitrophicus]